MLNQWESSLAARLGWRPASRWHSYMRGESSRLMSKNGGDRDAGLRGRPGAAPAYAMRWGKVRKHHGCFRGRLGNGVGSLYCSWAFWAKEYSQDLRAREADPFSLMQKPQALWELVKLINQYGTWGTTKDSAYQGCRALGDLGIGSPGGAGRCRDDSDRHFGKQPFCESCKLWCSASEKLFCGEARILSPQAISGDWRSEFHPKTQCGAKTTHLERASTSCPSLRG